MELFSGDEVGVDSSSMKLMTGIVGGGSWLIDYIVPVPFFFLFEELSWNFVDCRLIGIEVGLLLLDEPWLLGGVNVLIRQGKAFTRHLWDPVPVVLGLLDLFSPFVDEERVQVDLGLKVEDVGGVDQVALFGRALEETVSIHHGLSEELQAAGGDVGGGDGGLSIPDLIETPVRL